VTELYGRQLGFDSWQKQGIFFFSPPHPDQLWGATKSPIKWVQGLLGGGGVEQPGLETDHSPPSSTQVRNTLSYTPYIFMAWYLLSYKGKFTFTFNHTFILYVS